MVLLTVRFSKPADMGQPPEITSYEIVMFPKGTAQVNWSSSNVIGAAYSSVTSSTAGIHSDMFRPGGSNEPAVYQIPIANSSLSVGTNTNGSYIFNLAIRAGNPVGFGPWVTYADDIAYTPATNLFEIRRPDMAEGVTATIYDWKRHFVSREGPCLAENNQASWNSGWESLLNSTTMMGCIDACNTRASEMGPNVVCSNIQVEPQRTTTGAYDISENDSISQCAYTTAAADSTSIQTLFYHPSGIDASPGNVHCLGNINAF